MYINNFGRCSWTCGVHTENFFRNLIKSNQIRLYLPFSDWFGTKRPFVWFQITRKMVNTIWILFDYIWFRKDFSVCKWNIRSIPRRFILIFTRLFNVSFQRVFSTCLSNVSFQRVFPTCLFNVSFQLVFSTCLFNVSFQRVFSTCLFDVSFRRVFSTCISISLRWLSEKLASLGIMGIKGFKERVNICKAFSVSKNYGTKLTAIPGNPGI